MKGMPYKWVVVGILGFAALIVLGALGLSALGDHEGSHMLIEKGLPTWSAP